MRTRISHEDQDGEVQRPDTITIFFWLGTGKSRESVWHGVLSWRRSQSCVRNLLDIFSQQLPKNPLVLLCRTVDSQVGNEGKKIPSEELPHCSRKLTTCSWSLTSSTSALLDDRKVILSTMMTVALFLDHNHKSSFHLLLRMEVSFLFGLFF